VGFKRSHIYQYACEPEILMNIIQYNEHFEAQAKEEQQQQQQQQQQ
jgi:hypothetical protein